MVKRNKRRPRLRVTGGGRGVVNHVGARLLADVADETGLEAGLSAAMAPTRQRRGGRDRGEVLTDLAVMIADGGVRISDLAVLRDQPELFGSVAPHATAWRALDAVDDAALERIKTARAQARGRVWAAAEAAGRWARPDRLVIDMDGTLVISQSDKEQAAATYKKTYGFFPIVSYLDVTGEGLAVLLRAGNAGSGTAADHITVLDASLAQLPVEPAEVEVVVRTDSAGCSHGLLDACRDRAVRFIVGHPLSVDIASALVSVPARRWQAAITADGSDWRDEGEVAEITDAVNLAGWPEGTRMIARRENPHPGAQLSFTDADGHRFQVCVTDLDDTDIAYLEALYRGRGRAERRICDHKDTGLAKMPSASFAINQAWCQLTLIAHDLLTWNNLLVLDDDLARAEPKQIRYRLMHTAGTIAHTGRRTRLRVAEHWPWADQLITAFDRLHHLPLRI
ncbi:MAG TPA: IS1380 family transposase [Acidimicrobiales bacterium]|nr:IS1380 family transposase [Acidimicrobiales bacterium]